MKSYCQIYGQLDQTGDRITDEVAHLFSLGLVCDTSFKFAQGKKNRSVLSEIKARGGLVAPNVYPVDFDPTCHDPNWWKYPTEECVRLLSMAQKQFAELDLGPMNAINTYTPGNGFIAACRILGIHYIMGYCAPIVIEDGGWSVAHYGSPLSPFFVGEDDFRHPENPGDRTNSVLMMSMELRNPAVCMHHHSNGPWCTINALAADRWLEPSAEPLPYLQIAEDWLRQTELTGQPHFFHINLQYFFAGKAYEHCRRALEWLADQRDQGRLEVGGIQPWEKQMKAQGGFVPQTTYWRGEMMGYHVGHRPGSFPDVIVEENLDHQLIWKYPDAAPKRWYDYGKTWDYPAFEPTGLAPASEEISPVLAKTQVLKDDQQGHRQVEVILQNPAKVSSAPLALWSILDGCSGPFSIDTLPNWKTEIIPHPAKVGGAILLKGSCPTGETRLVLNLHYRAVSTSVHRRKWSNLIEAQSFELRHQTYTLLAAQTPERFTLTARVRLKNGVKPVQVESFCGNQYEQRVLPTGGLPLLFDGTRMACWHRFWGVTPDQLEIEGVEETELRLKNQTGALLQQLAPHLKVTEPGYQLFGNIRDTTRWDRQLGRIAGEHELAKMTEWFRQQRPQAGETLIEAHPGIYMPRGSITKALSHEFDHIQCIEGYGFKELCADYPQGWDWGVSAWVQWRWLRIRVDGLQNRKGPFTLHLHSFDPESRDVSLRVHFAEPHSKRPELCVAPWWVLPQGLEGRWDPAALRSIPIPEECLQWKAIEIWISPLEKTHLYDWIAEKGAPGMIFHVWVT